MGVLRTAKTPVDVGGQREEAEEDWTENCRAKLVLSVPAYELRGVALFPYELRGVALFRHVAGEDDPVAIALLCCWSQ